MEEKNNRSILTDAFNCYMERELSKIPDKKDMEQMHQFSPSFEHRMIRLVYQKHLKQVIKKVLLTAAGFAILIGITIPIVIGVKKSDNKSVSSNKANDMFLEKDEAEIELSQDKTAIAGAEQLPHAELNYQLNTTKVVATMLYTNVYEENVTFGSLCRLQEWDGQRWQEIGNGFIEKTIVEASQTEQLSVPITLEHFLDIDKSYQLLWEVDEVEYIVPVDISLKD